MSNVMYQTILFKAPGKPINKPVVVLSGLRYDSRQCSTPLAVRLSRTLSQVWSRVKCICTPQRLVTMACAVCVAATIGSALLSTVSDSRSVDITLAISAALGLPLAIAGAFLSSPQIQKGGKA